MIISKDSVKAIKRFAHYIIPTGILSVTTLLSYITGLLRDRTFAHTFGVGRELDIYNSAFIIPDLLLNIFIASALSPVLIPLFSSLKAQKKEKIAQLFATTVTASAGIIITILASVVMIIMPYIAHFVAPGFSSEEQLKLITMSRIMLISPMIMAISSSLGCLLVSLKGFIWYGISPVLYNIGLIGGSFLVPSLGLRGLAIGVIIGAFLHIIPRIIGIIRSNFRFAHRIDIRMTEFRQLLRLMLPKMFGHPVEQIKFLGFTRIASHLSAGSITAISLARNFQSVPISLFGISCAVAAFPLLSEAASLGDGILFKAHLRKALITILVLTVPSMLFLLIAGSLPIEILLGGGAFTKEDALRTTFVLGAFAFAIPTESIIHLLARSFYALKNTIIPVCLSIIGLITSISIATIFSKNVGIIAIPLGFFAGTAIEVSLLSFFLYRRLKKNLCSKNFSAVS